MIDKLKWWKARVQLWWLEGANLRKPQYDVPEPAIEGGSRNGIYESEVLVNWWVGYSPRNGRAAQCEGSWNDWVLLSRKILEEDRTRRLEWSKKK